MKDAIADAANPASPFHRPARQITLIHRAHQADLRAIVDTFKALPGYGRRGLDTGVQLQVLAGAHARRRRRGSSSRTAGSTRCRPGKQTWLTVRNDDMYYLRWGDPDFVRAYLTHLPEPQKIAGFLHGPDGYTWGRDFVSTHPAPPRELVIERKWYWFLLWGRLAYEPSIPNGRFKEILGSRFPGIVEQHAVRGMVRCLENAAAHDPLLLGQPRLHVVPGGVVEPARLRHGPEPHRPEIPADGDDEDGEVPRIMSVKAFVAGEPPAGRLTPLDVADQLEGHALAGLQNSGKLQPGSNTELRHTVGDIAAMGWLGRYYAEKIRGAVDLYRSRTSGRPEDLDNARRHLQQAASHWKQYAAIWSSQYVGQVLTRMGSVMVDIQAIQEDVDKEIPAVGSGPPR